MWSWINNNAAAINVWLNVGMLVIWAVYLQLLLVAFMRQRSANVLVTRGAGEGVNARCLVTNMSTEPVYIQSVLATVMSADRAHTASVTDREDSENADREYSFSSLSNQGPLDTGQTRDLGRFSDLIARVLRDAGEDPARMDAQGEFDQLELTVIGAYGQATLGMAAKRRFRLEGENRQRLVPTSIDTRQIRSRRGRRYVRDLLAQNR